MPATPEQRRQLADNAAIQRELGELSTTLKAIQANLTAADRKTEAYRDDVRETLTDLSGRILALEHNHRNLSEDMSSVIPVVDEVKAWKQRGLGALGIIGIAATALGITIGAGWDAVKDWIVGIFG